MVSVLLKAATMYRNIQTAVFVTSGIQNLCNIVTDDLNTV